MARPLVRDLTGMRIGRLLVERQTESSGGQARWVCKCDCGRQVIMAGSSLNRNAKSCGCLRWEMLKGGMQKTHGMRKSPLYNVWRGMLNRCHNPNQPHYERYGGRGITVCDEWRASFAAFHRDMGDRPTGPTGKRYTIERIDNEKPYCKANCKWATYAEQAQNKRPRRLRDERVSMTV